MKTHSLQKRMKKVICPECGKMVERGINANLHRCHRQMLAAVKAKGLEMA